MYKIAVLNASETLGVKTIHATCRIHFCFEVLAVVVLVYDDQFHSRSEDTATELVE
jgi:hypothetical protein